MIPLTHRQATMGNSLSLHNTGVMNTDNSILANAEEFDDLDSMFRSSNVNTQPSEDEESTHAHVLRMKHEKSTYSTFLKRA